MIFKNKEGKWITAKNSEILALKMRAVQAINEEAFKQNQKTEEIRREAVGRILDLKPGESIEREENGEG